jgi:tRNA(His) guanylyltransferase
VDQDLFEARMREGEYFHSLRLLPGAWAVIRVDGRGFSRLTETNFEKPFDPRMHEHMVGTASALLEEFQGVYAYTESDEISVAFPPQWSLFDRELEKIISLTAALASAEFSRRSGLRALFDSRVWMGAGLDDAVAYFRWRQEDAARCALNGWCYWTLRKKGLDVAAATAALEGATRSEKNELLFRAGINFNELPVWQRRGSGIYWEQFEKQGFNPVRKESVTALRWRVNVNDALPMKDEYGAFLRPLLTSDPARAHTEK